MVDMVGPNKFDDPKIEEAYQKWVKSNRPGPLEVGIYGFLGIFCGLLMLVAFSKIKRGWSGICIVFAPIFVYLAILLGVAIGEPDSSLAIISYTQRILGVIILILWSWGCVYATMIAKMYKDRYRDTQPETEDPK